jgi:cytochrome c-type biogenesis protein CcmE
MSGSEFDDLAPSADSQEVAGFSSISHRGGTVSRGPVVPTRRGSKTRVYVALGAIAVALGFIVVNGLGDAAQLYKEADLAVKQRAELGTKRFSIIGVVNGESIEKLSKKSVSFTIEQNGVQVRVRHTGVPPELFQGGQPVLLDGNFTSLTGDPVFESDRMAVKHSATYESNNPDRVTEGASYPAEPAGSAGAADSSVD